MHQQWDAIRFSKYGDVCRATLPKTNGYAKDASAGIKRQLKQNLIDHKTETSHQRHERMKGAAEKALKDLGADELGLIFKTPKAERQKPRPYVIAPLEGQIDGWFPLGEVSLVGAASGASKTTLMYQLLLAQERKEKFFHHETFGRSFVVFAVDRGEAAHE